MAGREADELLLAHRLGQRAVDRGAAIRGIGTLDRGGEGAAGIDGAEERAGVGIG
jgi:hypothetical protein